MNRHAFNHLPKPPAGSTITPPTVARLTHPTQLAVASQSGTYRPQAAVQRAVPQVAFQPERLQKVAPPVSRPPAPPAYRLQTSMQRAIATAARSPLQEKRAVSASASRPPAPPVYRPQAAVQRAVPSMARPLPQRPQTFPASLPPPLVPTPFIPAPSLSLLNQQRPGLVAANRPQFAIQPFAPHLLRPPSVSSLPGNSAFLTGDVVQRHGQVIQRWAYVGYVMDAISSVAIVGEIIGAIVASAGGATGWGWLVPLLLPAIGVLINGFISYGAEKSDHQEQLGEIDTPDTRLMYKVMTFIQLATTTIFSVALTLHDKNTTLKALAALTTSVVYIVAEFLRVRVGLSRKSLYREVWQMIQKCCPWCPTLACGQEEYQEI